MPMLYFAYGSNMNHALMEQRCPGCRFLKPVRLEGFRFVYDGNSVPRGGPTANIVTSEFEVVRGGLFEITERDRLALDAAEGYPLSYERRVFEVKDDAGDVHFAWAYYRTGRSIGKPHPDYEKVVLRGAADCRLPDDYVERYLRVVRL